MVLEIPVFECHFQILPPTTNQKRTDWRFNGRVVWWKQIAQLSANLLVLVGIEKSESARSQVQFRAESLLVVRTILCLFKCSVLSNYGPTTCR